MTKGVVTKMYEKYSIPTDPDYGMLLQSRYGTYLRHRCVLHHTKGVHKGDVLDLGCGTGLILDSMAGERIKPNSYVGVDMFPFVEPNMRKKAKAHGVKKCEFILKPEEVPFEELSLDGPFTVVLCIGVVSSGRYTSLWRLRNLISFMQRYAPHGAVTMLRQYADAVWEEGWVRFDGQDVADAVAKFGAKVLHTEREAIVIW